MPRDIARQTVNVAAAVGQFAAPALAPRLGGDIGAVSDQYPTLLTPATYAFAIWTLIFALCAAYAAYQARPARRADPLLRRVGWWTAAAMVANTLWELAFPTRRFVAANLLIFAMLAALVAVQVCYARAGTAGELRPASRAEPWLVRGAFSLFLGWITVASVANTAQTLTALGWEGAGVPPTAWAVALLGAAAAIGAWATRRLGANVWYALAVAWALAGIAVARVRADPALPSMPVAVAAALASLAVLGALEVFRLRRRAAAP
jgi:tryptophan-rich sensory protein